VALYSDVAPFAGNHFSCFRLLRRSVILHGTGKATAPIEDRDVRPTGDRPPQLAALLAMVLYENPAIKTRDEAIGAE
jgi:hypothetical protein